MLPAPPRLQQLGSPPVTGRLRERGMQRNSKDFAASLSAFMHACLPFSVALASGWTLSLLVLARVFFFLYLEAGALDQRRQGPR